MKRVISFILVAMLLVSTASAVDLYVDTEKIEFDTPPTIIDGRTLVPLRAIFEAIGAEVEWDSATRTATGRKGNTTVSLQIGNTTAYVNGETKTLDVPAKLIGGRTMVPVRFISEALGCNVIWDAGTSSVKVFSKFYNVVRVIDGDTIVVNYDGVEEKVRFIGVDAPESVHPTSSKNSEAGFAASEYMKVALEGAKVNLEFDVQERDKYGRLLAYVYLGQTMLNEKMLQIGLASVSTYPPNVKYVDRFTEIENTRDPSIPSEEYNDGYMKMPSVVYNTHASINKMGYTFLYVVGDVILVVEGTNHSGMVIRTETGYVTIMDMFDSPEFDQIKKGDHIAAGFIYEDYSDDLNMPVGAYIETLSIQSQQTTPTTPNTQTDLENNPPVSNPTTDVTTVYITKTGKHYHFDSHCNGGNYYESTLSEAKGRGLTPCSKCAK